MNNYSKIFEAAATRGRGLLIYNLDLDPKYFSGYKLVKRFVLERTSTLTEKVYLFQPASETNSDVLIRVSVAEMNNAENAKWRLRQELGQSMRPDIPQGTGDLENLGDLNFVGRSAASDLVAGISFARGNICVTVRSAGQKTVDVSDLAQQIDQLLSGEQNTELRASAAAPSAQRITARADEPPIAALDKLAPEKGWVRISVPEGELSREGNAVVFKSKERRPAECRMAVFE